MVYLWWYAQQRTFRTFLDCMYAHCGYIPKHLRESCGAHYRYWTQWECVKSMIKQEKMGPVQMSDLKYLAGNQSGFESLHVYHGSMRMRELAIHLERLVCRFPSARQEALKRAWVWLSGYESFEACWRNSWECRVATDTGIKSGWNHFDVDRDIKMPQGAGRFIQD